MCTFQFNSIQFNSIQFNSNTLLSIKTWCKNGNLSFAAKASAYKRENKQQLNKNYTTIFTIHKQSQQYVSQEITLLSQSQYTTITSLITIQHHNSYHSTPITFLHIYSYPPLPSHSSTLPPPPPSPGPPHTRSKMRWNSRCWLQLEQKSVCTSFALQVVRAVACQKEASEMTQKVDGRGQNGFFVLFF